MKWLGLVLAAGAIIAACQAVAVVLAVLVCVGLVIALFECPRELFGLIGLCAVVALVQSQPRAFIALAALMTIAKLFRRDP